MTAAKTSPKPRETRDVEVVTKEHQARSAALGKSLPVVPLAARAPVAVTFTRAWRHGGEDYQAGADLELPAAAAAKLRQRGAVK